MHQLDVLFMAKFMSMLVSLYLYICILWIHLPVSVIWHDSSGNHRHKQPLLFRCPAAQEKHEGGGGQGVLH